MAIKSPALLAVFILTLAAPGAGRLARVAAQADDDTQIRRLLDQVVQAISAGAQAQYDSLLAPGADAGRAAAFGSVEFYPGVTRAVAMERDRQRLPGTLPGQGFRLTIDVFAESGSRARIGTWQLDVRRTGDGTWRIADQERISSVDNVYRLAVNTTRQYSARKFTLTSEDLELTLADGSVFTIDTDQGITGLVLLGRGEMRFSPTPRTERGQLRIFAGKDVLTTRFESAYVRVGNLDLHGDITALEEQPIDRRLLRRAEDVFREESTKSFALDLGDLTSDAWSLLPNAGDFLAEVQTRRFDTLTYTRSRAEAEDISLFTRRRQRNISVYASQEKLAARGRFYSEDDFANYDVLDYEIDLSIAPDRHWLEGQTRLRLLVKAPVLTQLTLRLADPLVVHSVFSQQFGRMFNLRVRGQNTVLVNLPSPLVQDTELALTVAYSGRLAPQPPDRETLLAPAQREPPTLGLPPELLMTRAEPSFLYSNRSYWYPQPPMSDYATAVIRITVPPGFDCVASGEPSSEPPAQIPGAAGAPARRRFEFAASRPARYLSFVVSRFSRPTRLRVTFDDAPEAPFGDTALSHGALEIGVMTHPQQTSRIRELGERAAAIARYYHSLIGDAPYPSFTVALLEHKLPGGHSPPYFAVLNQPLPDTPLVWRNDPAAFDNYPEFFLAHELAHQWWGQAVGWRNYHEQWLSEGFAQYFAALYAGHHRGTNLFGSVLRQMGKWAAGESDQGPVYLGYRLGHLREDGRIFRALVYNKGAVVLHMLRQLVGDEAFFDGLRLFYGRWRYQKAGTRDLQSAMEETAGRPLERFFERWIYAEDLPKLRFKYEIDGTAAPPEVVLRFEQEGELFDVPVTVTLQYADRRQVDVLVPVTARTVEARVPLTGTLRGVEISRDTGMIGEVSRVS